MNRILCSLLVCLCLSGAFNIFAADIKIAIVGDSKEAEALADSVLAGISQEKDISVFERLEIDKILKEHKMQKGGLTSNEVVLLSKFVHVDFFILISSVKDKVVLPSGIMVFDAKTGARLLDKAIPEKSPGPSAFVVDEIKTALKKSDDKTSRKLISVLSVRNAGVPSKYNYALANIAAETERNLSDSSDVAVLERANLSLVNNERNLTSELYKLSPSAYLLDFEASPGDSTEKIILKVYVLSTTGAELAKFSFDDSMSNPSATSKDLVAKLSEFLSVSAPLQNTSPQAEAARFFKEFKYSELSGDWETAERKIEAAVALNPNSPDYRRELAYFITRKSVNCPKELSREAKFPSMLVAGQKMIEICNGIREQFPDYKAELYNPTDFGNSFTNILSNKNSLTMKQKSEAREFADIWRPLRCAEIKRLYYKFDLTDGINSLEEMDKVIGFSAQSSRLDFYMNETNYVNGYFEAMKEILKYGADFAENNPDIIRKLSYKEQYRKFVPENSFICQGNVKQVFENKLKNSNELIELAKNHPVPSVKVYGYTLEVIRKMFLNNYNKDAFEKDLGEMIKKVAKLDDFKYAVDLYKGSISSLPLFSGLFIMHQDLSKAYLKADIKLCRILKRIPDSALIINSCISDEGKKLAREIEEMEPEISVWLKPKNGDAREDSAIAVMATARTRWIKKLNSSDPECRRALEILNPPRNIKIEVKKLILPIERMDTAVVYDNKLYVVSLKNWQIYELDGDKTSKSVAKITPMDTMKNNFKNALIMTMDDKYFVIGGAAEIHLIKRNEQEEYIIKDLPAENVNAVTMMNDRIYAFVGRKGPGGFEDARETILFSCLPDGSDRKIHISTMRSEKKTSFDKQKPFLVSVIVGDSKKKRLIFNAGRPADGLYEFYPETGDEKRLIEFKYSSSNWGMQIDSILYIAGGPNNDSYYTFNMETDKIDFIFYRKEAAAIKSLKVKPVAVCDIAVMPPFFTRNGQIWFSCCKVLYSELSDFDNYIEATGISGLTHYTPILPHPDGVSALVVTSDAIYKVTPVKQK